MTVLVPLKRWYPLIMASLVIAVAYWGWPVEVMVFALAGSFVLIARDRWAPEFLAGVLAASAYWYGGWRWGIAGLLAAALLAWGLRRRQAEPSLSPGDGRG